MIFLFRSLVENAINPNALSTSRLLLKEAIDVAGFRIDIDV
jgi:hypothetical protein